MHQFHGNLLIGGTTLKHLEGELERHEHLDDSQEWVLAGRLRVQPEQKEALQCGRQYRLELEDRTAGLVEVSQIADADDSVVIEFHPRKA